MDIEEAIGSVESYIHVMGGAKTGRRSHETEIEAMKILVAFAKAGQWKPPDGLLNENQGGLFLCYFPRHVVDYRLCYSREIKLWLAEGWFENDRASLPERYMVVKAGY